LQDTHLSNAVLLTAIGRLSLFEDHRVRQRVNYSALDVEELGSVYESLLDFQPVFTEQSEGLSFELRIGSERKSTGSYYTRPELVRELIESALVPVMLDRMADAKDSDAAKEKEKQKQAILSMSVCDPACGSGHFLLAAARRLGRELARLQTIRPPHADLGFLVPYDGPAAQIAQFRAYLDRHPNPRPVLEWALRWAERHLPDPLPPVLRHGDFRTGNYLLASGSGGGQLTAILDWEFAGWGDPDEDIGWLCCKGWRFGRLDREAGGIADRAPLYRGYEAEAGRRLDPERVKFWEIIANIRWAIIAMQQSDRYLVGGARSLSTAITGRRATECELEVLMLLDPGGIAAHA